MAPVPSPLLRPPSSSLNYLLLLLRVSPPLRRSTAVDGLLFTLLFGPNSYLLSFVAFRAFSASKCLPSVVSLAVRYTPDDFPNTADHRPTFTSTLYYNY